MSRALLYVDTSALLDRVLGQKRHKEIAAAMRKQVQDGGRLVSSRLLHLEVRRVLARERLAGRDITPLDMLAGQVRALPLSEEVWEAAGAISFHAKTLDALHVATCQLVEATLLSSDGSMLELAHQLGVPIHAAVA